MQVFVTFFHTGRVQAASQTFLTAVVTVAGHVFTSGSRFPSRHATVKVLRCGTTTGRTQVTVSSCASVMRQYQRDAGL